MLPALLGSSVDSMMIILLAVPVDDDDRLLAESIWPTACCFSFLVKAKLVEYYRSIKFLGLESTIMDCLVYKSTEIKVVTYGKAICGSKLLLLRLTICFIVADSRALISKSSGLLRRLVEVVRIWGCSKQRSTSQYIEGQELWRISRNRPNLEIPYTSTLHSSPIKVSRLLIGRPKRLLNQASSGFRNTGKRILPGEQKPFVGVRAFRFNFLAMKLHPTSPQLCSQMFASASSIYASFSSVKLPPLYSDNLRRAYEWSRCRP